MPQTTFDPEAPAQVDYIDNGVAHGSVAKRLLASGFNVNALRPWVDKSGRSCMAVNRGGQTVKQIIHTNATLRYDEWKYYDQVVLKVAEQRLVGVNDLLSRGLSVSVPNAMGHPVFMYEDMTDIAAATISMDGKTRGDSDRTEYTLNYLPLPIVHKDFSIDARQLAASRNGNMPMDTTMAERAARKVAEKIEDMLFIGCSSYAYGGGTIYGFLDYPSANAYSLSQPWDGGSATGSTILNDVLGMKQASLDANYFGPWMLYVPTGYETVLDQPFTTNYAVSIRERLMQVSGLVGIKVVDRLTAAHVVLVNLSSDCVRVIRGLDLTPVEWSEDGGFSLNYKIMAIMVPQLRKDAESHCGIVVGS